MGWVFATLVVLAILFYKLAQNVWQLEGLFMSLSVICGLLAAVVLLGFGDPA